MKSSDPVIKYGQRLIRMVSELHRMGYQRLRIMPYTYPLAWRLAISHRNNFVPDKGFILLSHDEPNTVTYSSSCKNAYFGWQDATHDSARDMAIKFIQRYPCIVEQGAGRDWEYAGWLNELVGFLESDDILPTVMWESSNENTDPGELRMLPIWNGKTHQTHLEPDDQRAFPLPPI